MFRRISVIVLGLLVVGGVAFLVYILFFPKANPITQITATPESTTKEFFIDLRTKKADMAYARLSDRLKANYSEKYWKDEFFPRFADYKGEIKLVTNELLRPTNSSEPFPYDAGSEPWKLAYDFQFEGLTYRVNMVVIKKDGQWLINELEGAYLPQT